MTDAQLLDQYARSGSQRAFAGLVGRHAEWIYSAALRMVHDTHLAEDITQAVFLVLARNSRQLAKRSSLNSYLFRVTRYSSLHALRSAARRQRHERQAAAMISEVSQPGAEKTWDELAPHLDESVERLRRQDREAILLRFFQRKSMAEVGAALGVSEDAAKKRVAKAVSNLRTKLQNTNSTDVLGAALLANATHPIPIALAARCVPTAGALAPSVIAQGTLKMLFSAQLKLAISIILPMMLIPMGIGVYLHAAGASTPPAIGQSAPPIAGVPAAPATQPKPITLQGTWVYVSAEADGRAATLGADPAKIIFTDTEVHILRNGTDTVQNIAVDTSHEPAWVDVTPKIKTANQPNQHDVGIFSISGDELRMCVAHAGAQRPADFKTHPGDSRQAGVLKRVSDSTTLPPGPQRMADMMNLRQIGIAIAKYAGPRKGACPPNFGTLVRAGILKPDVFVSAEAGTKVPTDLNLQQRADWVTANSDYVYAGATMNLNQVKTPTTILAYDKDPIHGGKTINVLFADGHIQVMKVEAAHKLIDESVTKDQGL